VDGFSRMYWVYLLKDMTQVSDVIKNFINEIKTQFSTVVRILRAGNAFEYTQNNDFHFCDLTVYYTRRLVHTLHNIMM